MASLRAKFEAVLPHLDERQQRLVMAGEARSLGHGGIAAVARASGASRSRISQGVAELEAGQAPLGRVRRAGGGRKPVTATDPALVAALLALVEPTRRGDPESPLCWTTLSTRKLAAELTAPVTGSARTRWPGCCANRGSACRPTPRPSRAASIPTGTPSSATSTTRPQAHLAAGDPVISVDTKKKELVGPYKNGGAGMAPGRAARAGQGPRLHRPRPGQGQPVRRLRRGRRHRLGQRGHRPRHRRVRRRARSAAGGSQAGPTCYPHASRLLITADGGGSNGYRTRLWKTELAALAADTGLTITVCHLPPGTSKWNKIEHRLFSHISMNWRGRPLTSHEVIVQTIAATTTRTGLTVHAELDTATYPTGIKIPDAQMKALDDTGTLHRHDWHPRMELHPQPTPK